MSYSSEVLADSPLVYLRLGESSGTTAADSSGNSRPGTYYNSPTLGASGLVASSSDLAVNLDGSNDYVEVPYGAWMSSASAFTVEMWVKLDTLPALTVLAQRRNPPGSVLANQSWHLGIDNTGKLQLLTINGNGSRTAYSVGSLSTGTTYHVAVTFNAGAVVFYVNGVASGTTGTSFSSVNATPNNLTVGCYIHTDGLPYYATDGVVDEFAYYGTALSSTRVAAHYAAATAATPAGAIAATAPAATASAAGIVTTPGSIAATAPAAAASAAGTVTATGSIAATAPTAVASVEGISDDTTFGVIAATAPAATSAAAGDVTYSGAIAATAPAAVAAIEGDVTLPDGSAGSIAATAPAAVASIAATSLAEPIAGVQIPTPDGILVAVPLVPATPPASLDLVTFERRSHVMAVLSAEHPDHDPHGNCEHGDNTVVVEDVGTPQLWIGGRNVTFWRDKLTDVVRWESEVPFGDTAAAFEFPQMNPWDKPGEGDLDWLYPDAPVHVGIVDPEGGVRRVWSGFYDANGIGLAEDEDYPWEAKGTLWMAMHQVHEPRPLTEPVDIWVLIARTLNGVINRRWKRIPEEPIGITTLNRGARDSFLWEYVQELLSEAVTDDGRQWTISEVMPGVFRPVLKPASSVVHATVAVGTPGVDVDVRIDESTRVDGFYARAIGPDNGGWANVFYPGLQLLTPPPYPNDDASVIQIGDTDDDTDSGDGVSAIEQRLNELGRWGRVTVDGVWEASDAAVLYDAQGDLGILADGQPGPQTWNRLFNRSGEGISLDPLRLPLAVKPWVMPRLYDAAGVDIGPNPDHDPTRVPRLVPLDGGFGKTKRQMAKLCRALLAKYGEAGAAGTIRWELDPNETDRTRLSHLSNVEVLGHQGTDRVLQVSHKIIELDEGTATNPRQYVVTTRVDEHARDAMAVEDILEQRRSAIPDLSRRPGSLNRASRQVNDQRIPWDSESPCGYVRRTAINGAAGLPSVIPIPFAEVGKVAGIELTATQPFAFALFASLRITENRAQAIIGNPFASPNPFRPHYDALEPYGIIEAWGQQGDRCGYSPLTQREGGDFTGRFILNTPVDYWTETVPYVAMVVWFDGASGFISGRFIPAYEG